MSVAKKLTVGILVLLASLATDLQAQTPTAVPSRVERIARARWQPTRRVAAEEPEKLPEPVRPAPVQRPLPQAMHQEDGFVEVHPGAIHSAPYHGDAPCGCSSCASGGCETGVCDGPGCDGYGCDSYGCDSSPCDAMGACGDGCCYDHCGFNGPLPRLQLCVPLPCDGWLHAEYLMWWPRGMQIPPLVTTSPAGTARANAGRLDQLQTTTLVGGELLDEMYSGARLRFGFWTDRRQGRGLQFEVFGIGEENVSQSFTGNGQPILARPFFNVLTGREDAELVSFPAVLSGTVSVQASSSLQGVSAQWLQTYCRSCGAGRSILHCNCTTVSRRLNMFAGWRYLNLDEDLVINENLTSLAANEPGTFNITDRFDTRNQFNGADLGVLWNGRRGVWSMDLLMRLALGSTHQTVDIAGNTVIANTGDPNNNGNFQGGLLAQRTNIGSYSRNRFSAVPELGITLGYNFRPTWRATLGYTFLYWTNVVRPGEQIDRDVNPNLLPIEANPFAGALRPQFRFVETDLWVNGLNLGLEHTW